MSMINCPECHREISDMAERCPNCGYPIARRPQVNTTVVNNAPQNGAKSTKKKDSTLSVLAAIFAIFTCTSFVGLILGLIDLGINKGDGKRHIGSYFAIVYFIVAMIGLASMVGKGTDKSSVSNVSTISNSTKEVSDASDTSNDDLASQMSIIEYSMENTIGDTYYILVVKNNSSQTVELNVNAIAKDGEGKTIGAASSSENAVGVGQEVCLLNYFDSVKDAKTFEYTLSAKKDKYYDSVYEDLSVEESKTDEKVVLTVTNTGSKADEFVEAYALFFKNGELTGYDSTYITDDDFEIKPGATISKELNCYQGYDDVKVYFSGRK